jgi:hypothetical protein
MGVVEAISVSILVGLSVDYCFHVAEAYAISHETTRQLRVVDALTHMGSSVLSGALTTAGAAYFLLFCEIQIFHKFGVIVVVNTVLSVIYTIFFFAPMLALLGPNLDFGSLSGCVRVLMGRRHVAYAAVVVPSEWMTERGAARAVVALNSAPAGVDDGTRKHAFVDVDINSVDRATDDDGVPMPHDMRKKKTPSVL